MEIEFDDSGDEANRANHGVSLARGAVILAHPVGEIIDDRQDYGEQRVNAFGLVRSPSICLHLHNAKRRAQDRLGPSRKPAGATLMAIAEVTPELAAKALAGTGWQAVDAQTDEDIARNIAGDPDAAPILTEGETAAAIARVSRYLCYRCRL